MLNRTISQNKSQQTDYMNKIESVDSLRAHKKRRESESYVDTTAGHDNVDHSSRSHESNG